jgi:hypothetical protein
MIFAQQFFMNIRNISLFICVLLTLPCTSLAADILVAPPLFDLELQPRDIIKKDITVRNESDSKLYVYATVNEIAVDGSGDIKEFITPVMDQQEKAITSWVEINRGRIEMMPGEEKVVPLTIKVHPNAQAGEYHAFIGMSTESNRPLAEAKTMRGDAEGIILKVTIEDKTTDALRMTSFLVDRFVVTDTNNTISLTLKNEGSKASTPGGEIIFYNSRGEEVASLPVNTDGVTIDPQTEKTFELAVPFDGKLGRFKVNASILYGIDGKSNIFDTAQFYMIPFKLLLMFGLVIVLFSLFVTYLLRRVFYDELHSDDEPGDIPLYVRGDREHTQHDHDIHITKK